MRIMRKVGFLLGMVPVFLANLAAQTPVRELDNALFKRDGYWRGADGAATVALPSGKVLWLFSDTFIDTGGTGKRANAPRMIRNSIAIQASDDFPAELTYYFGGTRQNPDDFFKAPGKNWYWTGHGIVVSGKLLVFLLEETATEKGLGFEAVGWHLAVIDNPSDSPDDWLTHYYRGPDTFGVVVGSSAVLQDRGYVYAFGVKEPDTHETYLLRFRIKKLLRGDLSDPEWWNQGAWTKNIHAVPEGASLFAGQTEFSVHFDARQQKFVQVQTHGFGVGATIGYRLADRLTGPWSDPVSFFAPPVQSKTGFVYTANAHPELSREGLLITYNINDLEFDTLLGDESIYFPKIILLSWEQD